MKTSKGQSGLRSNNHRNMCVNNMNKYNNSKIYFSNIFITNFKKGDF